MSFIIFQEQECHFIFNFFFFRKKEKEKTFLIKRLSKSPPAIYSKTK